MRLYMRLCWAHTDTHNKLITTRPQGRQGTGNTEGDWWHHCHDVPYAILPTQTTHCVENEHTMAVRLHSTHNMHWEQGHTRISLMFLYLLSSTDLISFNMWGHHSYSRLTMLILVPGLKVDSEAKNNNREVCLRVTWCIGWSDGTGLRSLCYCT